MKNNWLINVLTDESGNLSSKRVISITCVIGLIILAIISCFRTVTISDTLITGIVTYGCVAMGATSVDKFSKKNDGTGTTE